MNHKILQYIAIFLTISAIAGGYFYFRGQAAQKINSSQTPKLTDGLVGYWTFDGADMTATTATDKSPVGSSSGTLVGASGSQNKPQPKIGKSGQGLNFDGTDDYVSIPAASGNPLDIDSNPVTISTWIKINTLPADIASFISRGSIGQGVGYGIFLQSNGDLRVGGHGGSQIGLSGTTLTTGTWYHVVGITNGASSAIYLNGALNNTGTVNVVSDNKNFWLGASCSDSSCMDAASMDYFFNGSLDETRVYSRALSVSEITELYQQGQTKINASQTGKLTDGLELYYSFDGANMDFGQAAIVRDSSGNGRHGTPTDSTNAKTTMPALGKNGQAFYCNGAANSGNGQRIVPNPTLPATTTTTYSVWAKFPSQPSMYPMFLGGGGTIPSIGFGYTGYSGKLVYASGATVRENNTILNNNQWYHISFVRNGNSGKFYLNGQEDGTVDLTGIEADQIGQICDKGSSGFYGYLDELRIYSRALSASEITELYQQGQTKINASQTGKLTDGLVFYHSFDGNHMDWSQAAASRDQVGTAHGTLGATTTLPTVTIGKVGQALNFNGDDWVNFGDVSAVENQTALTVSVWVNLNARNVYDTMLQKNGIFSLGIDADYSGTEWSIGAGIGSGWAYSMTNIGPEEVGTWHLWTMVFDGTQATNATKLKVYHDADQNVLDFSTPGMYVDIPSSVGDNVDNVYIGNISGPTRPNAKIDEVRVYNRALSQSEVTELYNQGR